MANDKSETLTAIKTPVYLSEDVNDGYHVYRMLDADGDIIFNGMLARHHPVEALIEERDLLAHIGLCINEHESLANELRETKAKLADREIVNCAICTTPLPFPETIPGCCFKCALNETEELWGNAIRLRDCVECGQQGFAISPINPSEGFCWKCHKLLTIEKQ